MLGGAGLAELGRLHEHWATQHPGTIALGLLTLVVAAGIVVQLRMNRAAAQSDARAERFRMAMLAEYAPHLLEPAGLLLDQPIPTRAEAQATLRLNVVELPQRYQWSDVAEAGADA